MNLPTSFFRSCCYRGLLWHRGHKGQVKYSREFEKSQYYPTEQIRENQFLRLRSLLENAYLYSPFYQQRFKQIGLHPSDIRKLEDIMVIPALEKTDLQEQRNLMVSIKYDKKKLVLNQTGGSSGTPVSFYVSPERLLSRTAATLRHNRWAGWDIGDKVAILWGAPMDRPSSTWFSWFRQRIIDRQLFLDTGFLTEESLWDYYQKLIKFRPKIMLAYARSAVLFAQFLLAHKLPPISFQSIVTSAEVLTVEDRNLLECVFHCPVFNRYGSREFSIIASECSAHEGLHVMAEGLYLEIVHGGKLARPGEMGSILVTDLLNHAMPLIRYRIGDVGSWLAGNCSCGRHLPRLDQVAGRVTDFLVGGDGRVVSGAFLTIAIVAQRVSLGQVQILQEKAGTVTFRIKPGPGFSHSQDLKYLENATQKYLGQDTVVHWEFVTEIPPLPSGKYAFSISKVVPDFLKTPPSEHVLSFTPGPST